MYSSDRVLYSGLSVAYSGPHQNDVADQHWIAACDVREECVSFHGEHGDDTDTADIGWYLVLNQHAVPRPQCLNT